MLKPLDILFINEEDKVYEITKLNLWQIYMPKNS
jgi:uncharacterized membrane protein (UPF0127 family)